MNLKKHVIFIMLAFFCASISFSQDLDKHHWKDRVLLILTKNLESKVYKKQVEILKSSNEGIQERKLIVYIKTEKRFQIGIDSDSWFFTSKKSYLESKKTSKDFEIVLIGLDGGVKLRQTEILTKEKLFTIIDGMLMRKQELRNKKQNKE